MPDITQRIADILDKHSGSGAEGDGLLHCWCGSRFNNFAAHSTHVAEVLTTELGLTREWAVGYREFDGVSNVIPRKSQTDAEILNMDHDYSDHQGYSVVSRYVTDWMPE